MDKVRDYYNSLYTAKAKSSDSLQPLIEDFLDISNGTQKLHITLSIKPFVAPYVENIID